jgi:hypothetical protein
VNLFTREKVSIFNKTIGNMNLSKDLQTKVKKYLEFVWDQEQRDNPEQESLIMGKLSNSLRDEIYLETRVTLLRDIPIFKKILSEPTLVRLAHTMKKVRFSPEELVYQVLLKIS